MRIFGITITRDKKDIVVPETKALTWEKLWGAAREYIINKNKVTKPYAQVPSVYKAVKAICDNVPQAEMALYDWATDEEIENSDDGLLTLLMQPNPKQSGNDFMQELVGYYALYNEVFILKVNGIGNVTGARKIPAELRVLDPQKMKEITNTATEEVTGWRYQSKVFTIDEVIHVKDFNPYSPYRGLNPSEPMGSEMNLDYLANIFNMAFFSNDATPNAILMSEKSLTLQQREALKLWMEKRHRGADNKHKMDVLEGGLKIETITPSHKDMEFTEQRKFSREELLGAWRAPKALFNITEDLNYATFQGQMKVFWLYAIMPILRKIEDSINIHIVWPYDRRIYFAFDIKNVPAFQEDFAGKVTTAKTLFDMGFTGNEINQKLNLGFDDKDWREFWWINSLMLPADQVMLGGMDPNNMPEDTPPADEKPKKEAPRPDMLGWGVWKSFVARQGPVERIMERKLSRYFFEQRGRILAALNEQNMRQGPDVINWENEDTILKKYIRPVMEQAVKDGVAHGQDQVGKKSSTEAITKSVDSRVVAYIEQRIAQIVGINNTTRKMLRYSIDEAISAGQTIAEIQDVVKERYNLNAMRSLRIARTETSGAVNGGSKIYYQEVGIQKNKWITAGDELVRASHRACEAQGAIKMDSAFVNGCRYPGDQEVSDPGEVVNCRCVLSPVLE